MDFDRLYAELETNAETIAALVKSISQEEAQVKPTPDSWSILEVVCHLYDEERNDFRPRLDIILHRPNEPFAPNNPQEWVTERKYNERDLGEMLENFLAERVRSLDWLTELSGANWDAVYTSRWGSLTAGEMFTSWVAHDTLHMRQLVELRHDLIVRLSQPYDTAYAGDW